MWAFSSGFAVAMIRCLCVVFHGSAASGGRDGQAAVEANVPLQHDRVSSQTEEKSGSEEDDSPEPTPPPRRSRGRPKKGSVRSRRRMGNSHIQLIHKKKNIDIDK